MVLPSPDTRLYNHPLPDIEQWLSDRGCQRDDSDLHRWFVEGATWRAEITLDREDLVVRYINADGGTKDITRSFPYSLTRQDVEDAVFSGP